MMVMWQRIVSCIRFAMGQPCVDGTFADSSLLIADAPHEHRTRVASGMKSFMTKSHSFFTRHPDMKDVGGNAILFFRHNKGPLPYIMFFSKAGGFTS